MWSSHSNIPHRIVIIIILFAPRTTHVYSYLIECVPVDMCGCIYRVKQKPCSNQWIATCSEPTWDSIHMVGQKQYTNKTVILAFGEDGKSQGTCQASKISFNLAVKMFLRVVKIGEIHWSLRIGIRKQILLHAFSLNNMKPAGFGGRGGDIFGDNWPTLFTNNTCLLLCWAQPSRGKGTRLECREGKGKEALFKCVLGLAKSDFLLVSAP